MLGSFHGFRKNLREELLILRKFQGEKEFLLAILELIFFLQAGNLTVYSVLEQPLSFNSNPKIGF